MSEERGERWKFVAGSSLAAFAEMVDRDLEVLPSAVRARLREHTTDEELEVVVAVEALRVARELMARDSGFLRRVSEVLADVFDVDELVDDAIFGAALFVLMRRVEEEDHVDELGRLYVGVAEAVFGRAGLRLPEAPDAPPGDS